MADEQIHELHYLGRPEDTDDVAAIIYAEGGRVRSMSADPHDPDRTIIVFAVPDTFARIKERLADNRYAVLT
jgi:hypothetical protein